MSLVPDFLGRPLLTLATAAATAACVALAAAPAMAGEATSTPASADKPEAGAGAQTPAGGAASTSANAQPTVAAKAAEAKLPSESFPLSGEVSLGASVASGTLVSGEGNRPGVDGYLSLRAVYQFMPGLSLSASELVYHNIVTNADSGAVRPYNTDILDPFVTLAFSPQTTAEDGTRKPFTLPGGIRIGTSVTARPPVSRASHYATQYFAIGPAVSLSRPNLFGMLSLAIGTSIVKNFNKSTNAAVDGTEFRALGRPNGAEQLSGNLIATSTVNVSFYLRHSLSASLQLTERLNFSLMYLLINSFSYYDAPSDQYASKNAVPGRGRSDTQWGIASATYGFDKAGHTSISLAAYTISAPFSADNKTYRFPFYDFRSTADNYSSLNLSLSQAF